MFRPFGGDMIGQLPMLRSASGTLFAALLVFNASIPAQTPHGTLTTLYSFTGGSDGFGPFTGVAVGAGGVLYGTANGATGGNGTAFSLTPPATPGGTWTESAYSFPAPPPEDWQ
jgi:hypothetical protein